MQINDCVKSIDTCILSDVGHISRPAHNFMSRKTMFESKYGGVVRIEIVPLKILTQLSYPTRSDLEHLRRYEGGLGCKDPRAASKLAPHLLATAIMVFAWTMYFSIWLASLVPLRGQLRGQRIVCHATPHVSPNSTVDGMCELRHNGNAAHWSPVWVR